MRSILPMVLLLAACSPDNSAEFAGVYGSGPRDRICLTGGDDNLGIGLIAYGKGQANCSFKGRAAYIEGTVGPLLEVHPQGDTRCEFHIDLTKPDLVVTPNGPACDYYCGPGASLEGKAFSKLEKPEPVEDLAGEPLC